MADAISIESVRSVVRYVDESQAIIDALVAVKRPDGDDDVVDASLLVEITSSNGFYDECCIGLPRQAGQTKVRLDLVHPDRWWPACMGEQPLYELTVRLVAADQCIDTQTITLGLTSIRPDITMPGDEQPHLLVNGQVCGIHSIVTVDRINEQQLLPATGDSLLLVRDHYGPDLLYQAADRAGILMIQCIPVHAEAVPEMDVEAEVDRLASHPSLAGWFVGHMGQLSDVLAQYIAKVDPAHTIFRELPAA